MVTCWVFVKSSSVDIGQMLSRCVIEVPLSCVRTCLVMSLEAHPYLNFASMMKLAIVGLSALLVSKALTRTSCTPPFNLLKALKILMLTCKECGVEQSNKCFSRTDVAKISAQQPCVKFALVTRHRGGSSRISMNMHRAGPIFRMFKACKEYSFAM